MRRSAFAFDSPLLLALRLLAFSVGLVRIVCITVLSSPLDAGSHDSKKVPGGYGSCPRSNGSVSGRSTYAMNGSPIAKLRSAGTV